MNEKNELKNNFKAAVVIAIALAFVIPGATVLANTKTQLPGWSANGVLGADFTMMIEDTFAIPGMKDHLIPVNGSWIAEFNKFTMKILFDNTKLEAKEVDFTNSVVQGDWMKFSSIHNNEGYAVITAYCNPSGSPISPGSGNLANIIFDVFATASPGVTFINFTDGVFPTAYYPEATTWNNPMIPELINGILTIEFNNPPEIPIQPDGSTEGEVGVEYCYKTNTTDPEGHQVYYKWDFGDEVTGWIGPFESGKEVEECHKWSKAGTYDVKVKAKDICNSSSNWSKSLTVEITEPVPDLDCEGKLSWTDVKPGSTKFETL